MAACSSSSSGAGVAGLSATATACPGSSTGVSIPQIAIGGGQKTPVAAAEHFVKAGAVGNAPTTGWHVVVQNSDGAYLRSGNAIMHANQGSDGTWVITSERTCT